MAAVQHDLQLSQLRSRAVADRAWLMAQTWQHVLFAHWPVSLDQLRHLVPPPLEIDTFANQAWLGIVAFQISRIHLHGLPSAPGLAQFPEVNLRTYVRYRGRPGVLFLSLHCPNRLAMALARPWFRLPYKYAAVHLTPSANAVDFASRSPAGASFVARYGQASDPFTAAPDSRDAWLTERYCYFTVAADGRLFRCDIQHAPWSLARAEAEVTSNTLAQPFHLELPDTPPLLHCADRTDAIIWPLHRER
jgi:uncharacterized protein YqjF (DUF2071 family)